MATKNAVHIQSCITKLEITGGKKSRPTFVIHFEFPAFLASSSEKTTRVLFQELMRQTAFNSELKITQLELTWHENGGSK